MNLEGLAVTRVNLGVFDRIRVAVRNPDLRPAWKEARKPVRKDLRDHANKQAGPDGSWPGYAETTKKRQAEGRKKPRRLLGRLPGAVRSTMNRTRLLFTWRTKWAEAQRIGGTVGHGARLPARDWAFVSDKATQIVADIVAKGIAYLIEVS